MLEFYVTYEWQGLNYVAHVSAPAAPDRLCFADYEDFRAVMDGLGHAWMLTCETPEPDYYAFDSLEVWTKQLTQVREFVPQDPVLGRRRDNW